MTREGRFATRFGLAIGIWALAFAAGIVIQGCDSGGTITGPTTTTTSAPAAAAPSPTATPALIDPATPSAFELACLADSTLTVKYIGQASRVTIETFYTSFDNQDLAFGKQSHTINAGDTATRAFGQGCIQGDADQPGVKLIGGCFFDKDSKPFIPSRNPEKVAACRTTPCVETEEPNETPGAYSWAPEVIQGQCQSEQFPLGINTFTPTLGCHQIGTQKIAIDWICKADDEKIRNLCRNVACPTPPPTCESTTAFFKGNANGGLFNLANSGDASELAWVNANVGLGPWEKFDDEGEKDDDCTGADTAAKIAIVKAGSSNSIEFSYKAYLNVTQGQQLCSYDPPGSVKAKDISHVTYFRCGDDD